MTDHPDDPLSRALHALTRAQGVAIPPEAVDALKQVSDALSEALDERTAFVTVANAAMTLVEVLDDYEEAVEDGDEARITAAAEAGEEAEDALVDALNELHALVATDADLTGDVAYLADLNLFNDDENMPTSDGDASPPAERANLRMKFGAEMNDPPGPPPAPPPLPEEPANTDIKPGERS